MWDIIGKAAVFCVSARVLFSILKGLYGSFFAASLGLNKNLTKLGKWAVITGATDGIGKAFVFEIAQKGINIVLISRNPFKLQNVASEITSKYGVEAKIIDVDFTKTDIYDRIRKELEGLDIGILINNVGVSYEMPEHFKNLPEKKIHDLIACNIMSMTIMTKIVLPGMVERRKGLIVNVSSLSSMIATPLLAVYAATKSYISSLSESLSLECADSGVTVQCLAPGFVVSNMSRIRRPTLMCPTAMAYVRSALRTTGIEKLTAGYFMHKLEVYFIELAQLLLPGFVLSNTVLSKMKNMHQRAIKKKERDEKAAKKE